MPPPLDVAVLSLAELRSAIKNGGRAKKDLIERADLEAAAQEAMQNGATFTLWTPAPPPRPNAATHTLNHKIHSHPQENDEVDLPFTELAQQQIFESWTEQAMRIQLIALGKAPSASRRQMVHELWAAYLAEGIADDEYARRRLRVGEDPPIEQAAAFISAVSGVSVSGATIVESLHSGVILCNVANHLLVASGMEKIKVNVIRQDATSMAAESRQRVLALENLSRFVSACVEFGIPRSSTFEPEDLFDGGVGLRSVVKTILELAQVARTIIGYYGPHLGRRNAHDWRTNGKGAALDDHTRAILPKMKPARNWKRQYEFIDTVGIDDDEAALRWIEEALNKKLQRPLYAALKSGAVLCQLLDKIYPNIVSQDVCQESVEPFEQIASIDAYLSACSLLKVKLRFVTVDLSEKRDLPLIGRQIWSLASVAQGLISFPGPQLGSLKAAEAAAEAFKVRSRIEESRARERERERRRIERDMISEAEGADVLIKAELRDQARQDAKEREVLAIEASRRRVDREVFEREQQMRQAEKDRRRKSDLDKKMYSMSGWMYKRGGMAKIWRKRWFVVDGGILSYFPSRLDEARGSPPIGKLRLKNASTRRPSSSKGKYASTCLRLDLESADANLLVRDVGTDSDGAEVQDDLVGSKSKTKFLLAAESVQAMHEWMAALAYWSMRFGTTRRRSTLEMKVSREEMLRMVTLHEENAKAEVQEELQSHLARISQRIIATDLDDSDVDSDLDQDGELEEQTASEDLNQLVQPSFEGVEPQRRELLECWTEYALRWQLSALNHPPIPTGTDKVQLVDLYFDLLGASAYDENVRRWLKLPQKCDDDEKVQIWIACLTGKQIQRCSALAQELQSGEILCDVVNAIRHGMVPFVIRRASLDLMSDNRRKANMRENICQYLDACAELGLQRKSLFHPDDLLELKNWDNVLHNILSLGKLCHFDVEGFPGPHIGKKRANRRSIAFTGKYSGEPLKAKELSQRRHLEMEKRAQALAVTELEEQRKAHLAQASSVRL